MRVLVLEDMPDRIKQLNKWLEGLAAELVWTKTVAEFRERLTEEPPALVILDHDLGAYSDPGDGLIVQRLNIKDDQNGECGQDAAKAVPANYPAPVVVWSINPSGAQSMIATMRSKGVACEHVPFTTPNHFRLMKICAEAVSA